MSKVFRIPGLRVGFAIGDPELIARLRHFARPWSVNSLAQAAVLYLLANARLSQDFVYKSQVFVGTERDALMQHLENVPGVKVFPSQTSFLLVKLPAHHRADAVCRHLRAARVLLRDCTNFDGLSAQFIRISLKTPDVNRQCAAMLASYLTA